MDIFGTKRLIKQYEARLVDKDKQIADLRLLVFAPPTANQIPLVALEADAVMSGKDNVIELSREETEKILEEQSEASRILSGTYGNDT